MEYHKSYSKYKKYIEISQEGFNKLNQRDKKILIDKAKKCEEDEFRKDHPWLCIVLDFLKNIINNIKEIFYRIINNLRKVSKDFVNKINRIHKNISKMVNDMMKSDTIYKILVAFKIIIKYIINNIYKNHENLALYNVDRSISLILNIQKEFVTFANEEDKFNKDIKLKTIC